MNCIKICVIVFASSLFLSSLTHAEESVNYEGDGAETDGINSYMTYPGIMSSNLEYRLGKKRVFRISYGKSIDVNSFSAVLNGKNISKRFHPAPGEVEKVYLPLHIGVNILKFKVSDIGDADASVAHYWDADEFSITVLKAEATAKYLETPPGFEKRTVPPSAAVNSKRPEFIDKSRK